MMNNIAHVLRNVVQPGSFGMRSQGAGLLLVAVLLPIVANAQIPLYRVNAGGAALASLDAYTGWDVDTAATPSSYHGATGSAVYGSTGGTLDASVPATTPAAVFDTERYDVPAAPDFEWDFPLGTGGTVEVRLYFMNSYSGTSSPGDRLFDVVIEGTTVLSDYDIVADVGHNVGVMKSFTVASDGNLDIDFLHGSVENPLVNAIEILGDPAVADEGRSWGELKSLFRR